jgi:hypothetical protein
MHPRLSTTLTALLVLVCVQEALSCESVFPHKLDVGLFALASRRSSTTGKPEAYWKKLCTPEDARDTVIPNKDTYVITHGLQQGYVEADEQFGDIVEVTDILQVLSPGVPNILMFRWTQFADDAIENFERVEAKIYDTRAFNGMQYLFVDTDDGGHKKPRWADAVGDDRVSVADRFAIEFVRMFNGDTGWHASRLNLDYEIRLIGHSLGSQLVTATAFRIMYPSNFSNVADALSQIHAPHVGISRVTLLDPMFSIGNRLFFNNINPFGPDVMHVLSGYIERMLADFDIPTESYKTSKIRNCEGGKVNHVPILKAVAYERVKMLEWGNIKAGNCFTPRMLQGNPVRNYKDFIWQSIMEHIYAIEYYFKSAVFPPHQCIRTEDHHDCMPIEALALSAAMDTPTVRYYAQHVFEDIGKGCFVQFNDRKHGRNMSVVSVLDHSPENDLFYLQTCDSVNF